MICKRIEPRFAGDDDFMPSNQDGSLCWRLLIRWTTGYSGGYLSVSGQHPKGDKDPFALRRAMVLAGCVPVAFFELSLMTRVRINRLTVLEKLRELFLRVAGYFAVAIITPLLKWPAIWRAFIAK